MRDFDIDLIQVLWVEDDPEVTEKYPEKAETFGLQLEAYPCWDDARIALEKEFDRWSAIILDAKCKYHRDSGDNAIEFLREALDDISTICKEKGRMIPWYVLTGGDTTEVSDSINDKRLKWDGDWTEKRKKKYYSKNTDNEDLFKRIKEHAKKSHRLQVYGMYQEVIDHLNSLNCNNNMGEIVIDIFEVMHYPDNHSKFNPILYYNQLRQILEYNFRAANKVGIVPDACFDKKGNPNLSQCCHYLSGNNATEAKVRYGEWRSKDDYDRVVPKHIELMMRMILDIGNINSHSVKLEDSEEEELNRYINDNVFNSRYLIYSLALNACEITVWFMKYINNHQDRGKNLKMCTKLDSLKEKETERLSLDNEKEDTKRYFGKINKERNKVYSDDLGMSVIIERNNGFIKNCSPKEYDYVENEKVYFELMETVNPKTQKPFSFAINIVPARKVTHNE